MLLSKLNVVVLFGCNLLLKNVHWTTILYWAEYKTIELDILAGCLSAFTHETINQSSYYYNLSADEKCSVYVVFLVVGLCWCWADVISLYVCRGCWTDLDPDTNAEEEEEKRRLINQVLELQNTLDGDDFLLSSVYVLRV